MNHTCLLDDRGFCEVCETANQNHNELWKGHKSVMEIMSNDRIPANFEFPDAYEMGKMENGIWD